MLGKGRLSMQAIMERLTAKAYNEYDGAVRAHIVARLLQEAVAVAPESKPSMGSPYPGTVKCGSNRPTVNVMVHVVAHLLQEAVAMPHKQSQVWVPL